MQLEDDASKNLSAEFELSGQRTQGQLWLSGALGTTLAIAQWSRQNAQLQAQGQTRDYPDLDALLHATLGIELPVDAFFDWLEGRAHPAPGWRVDLSDQPKGRLRAWRDLAPRARLSLVWTLASP